MANAGNTWTDPGVTYYHVAGCALSNQDRERRRDIFLRELAESDKCRAGVNSYELNANHIPILQVFDLLRTNPSVRRVSLCDLHLTASGLRGLGDVLRYNQSIQTLTLDQIFVGDSDPPLRELFAGFKANSSLTHLQIRKNSLSPADTQGLVMAIAKLPKLLLLELCDLAILDEVRVFTLPFVKQLTIVRLRNCMLKDVDLAIMVMLLDRAKISDLDLSHNDLGEHAADSLATFMLDNKILQVFRLVGNESATPYEPLLEGLRSCKALRAVAFGGKYDRQWSQASVHHFECLLQTSATLQIFRIEGHLRVGVVTYEQACMFVAILVQTPRLRTIDIDFKTLSYLQAAKGTLPLHRSRIFTSFFGKTEIANNHSYRMLAAYLQPPLHYLLEDSWLRKTEVFVRGMKLVQVLTFMYS
jgi:hypothetical protein